MDELLIIRLLKLIKIEGCPCILRLNEDILENCIYYEKLSLKSIRQSCSSKKDVIKLRRDFKNIASEFHGYCVYVDLTLDPNSGWYLIDEKEIKSTEFYNLCNLISNKFKHLYYEIWKIRKELP